MNKRGSWGYVFFVLTFYISTYELASDGTKDKKCHITRIHQHDDWSGKKYVILSDCKKPCMLLESSEKEAVFLCPGARLSSKSRKNIKAMINIDDQDKDADLSIIEVEKPVSGVKVVLRMNKQQGENKESKEGNDGFITKTFASITGETGFLVRYVKGDALKSIRSASSSKIRRYTYAAKPSIVLDYGHGGIDKGCSQDGFHEKDITSAVGKKISHLLKKKGYTVCLTRTDDETVALDERTKRALQCNKAALLVSLHVNSSTDRTISGVETFYHKPQLFNDESECGISPVMKHSIDSHDMCYYEESKKLGTVLHKTLVSDTNLFLIKDRGVHSKVSQLLLGAHVPSVLIEMGYLTNDDERKNLVTAQHQQELALRIVKGIELYLDEYLIA